MEGKREKRERESDRCYRKEERGGKREEEKENLPHPTVLVQDAQLFVPGSCETLGGNIQVGAFQGDQGTSSKAPPPPAIGSAHQSGDP